MTAWCHCEELASASDVAVPRAVLLSRDCISLGIASSLPQPLKEAAGLLAMTSLFLGIVSLALAMT
ncbi:hypothetical protein D6821_01980 [Candidatus Parcubacteria bacterium]|nr:MAG: hypothetical protein D6821_01980 [Candidatus Parcubacteria bacterium]